MSMVREEVDEDMSHLEMISQAREAAAKRMIPGGIIGMRKEGEDLLLFPARCTNATFRIDNVMVKAHVSGQPKESVMAGMGIKIGKAARDHVRQFDHRSGVRARRAPEGEDLTVSPAAFGMNESDAISQPRGSSDFDDLNDSASSIVSDPPTPAPVGTPKQMIVPKFISSDPAYFSSLCGLQVQQASHGAPGVNPYRNEEVYRNDDLGVSAIQPVLERFNERGASELEGALFGSRGTSSPQSDPEVESALVSHGRSEEDRYGQASCVDDTNSVWDSGSVSSTVIEQLKAELAEIDFASRGEVEGLKGEVNGMRDDLDRMFGMLAKIHRKMTNGKDDSRDRKGGGGGGSSGSGSGGGGGDGEGAGAGERVGKPGLALNLKREKEGSGKSTRTQQVLRQFAQRAAWQVPGEEVDLGTHVCVGEGTISHVFKATWKGLEVAIKMLRLEGQPAGELPDFAVDLGNELSCVSMRLQHPNICQFLGAGSISVGERQLPFILYELVGGGSILDVMQAKSEEQGEPWVPARPMAVSWCQQLMAALAVLHGHQRPLAHRDIKPANLLVTPDLQTLKLADFSLATPLSGKASDTYFVAGSMRYMAPEVSATVPFDLEKADMYSAALTAWCIVYGKRPYEDVEDSQRVLLLAGQGVRPQVPDKDVELGVILGRAWDAVPANRAKAAQVAQWLTELLQKEKGSWGKKMFSKLRGLGGSMKRLESGASVSGDASPTNSVRSAPAQ